MVHADRRLEDNSIILPNQHNTNTENEETNVSYQIHSRHLLHHLSTHTQQRAMQKPLRPVLEHHLKRTFRASLALLDNGARDLVHFSVDHGVVFGDVSRVRLEGPDDLATFFALAVCD